MKIREYIKAGIGFTIGMMIVSSVVALVNQGIDNELKKMQETFGKEIDSDEKTEKAE